MNDNLNYKFQPIRCTSTQLFQNGFNYQDGQIYFLTDTRQTYLVKNNELVEMGGGIRILYGNKTISHPDNGTDPPKEVIFHIDEIESDISPIVNDLILNTDGCFYTVKSISGQYLQTIRVTLQGTGSIGGSTGGGGGGAGSSGYQFYVVQDNYVFSTADKNMYIKFYAESNTETTTYIKKVSFTKDISEKNGGVPFYSENGKYSIGIIGQDPIMYSIDLKDYQSLFEDNTSTVYLNITDNKNTQFSYPFDITVIHVQLQYSDSAKIMTANANTYAYKCNWKTSDQGIKNKEIEISIFAENDLTNPIVDPQIFTLSKTSREFNIDISKIPHGVYLLQARMKVTTFGDNDEVFFSNTLNHKLMRIKSDNTNVLFAAYAPTECDAHVSELTYLKVFAPEDRKYTVRVFINGQLEKKLSIMANAINLNSDYKLLFKEKGTYSLYFDLEELPSLKQEFTILVNEYDGDIPIIDANASNLLLYLTPEGKTNSDIDRNTWTSYDGKQVAILSDNMQYNENSGWLKDESGASYLYLTSGSSLTVKKINAANGTLDKFDPFEIDPTKEYDSTTDTDGLGMTIELDFEVSDVTNFGSELIKCMSYSASGNAVVGFSATGNNISVKPSDLMLKYVENKRVRIAIVFEHQEKDVYAYSMCLGYLNGIISGGKKLDAPVESDPFSPAVLSIDSTGANIKIYGIRIYSKALTDSEILQNYTASLSDLTEREKKFNSNNIYTGDKKQIDYNAITKPGYNLEIPYMTITGGWSCKEDSKWELKENPTAGLPVGKKDYKMINVSVKYPKTPQFDGYQDYEFVNQFDNFSTLQEAAQAGNVKASNGGCIMYAQGTSSMEYPVKNLRIRWKKSDNYFKVKPDIDPVEIICMKADFMESSGSHNTGAANLVDKLYKNANLQTPAQKYFTNENIVTAIKGYPCLIFYREKEEDEYTYIGKYNLNLDKATPEPFGFKHDDNFGYLAKGDKYYKVEYYDEKDLEAEHFIGQHKPQESGDYYPMQDEETEELAEVQEDEKVNSIHCFEFLDNATAVCNFLIEPGKDSYEKTWYEPMEKLIDGKKVIIPGWANGFESRYPDGRIGYHDADMLYPLASWIHELYTLSIQEEGTPKDKIPVYRYDEIKKNIVTYENLTYPCYYKSGPDEYVELYHISLEDFTNKVYYHRSLIGYEFQRESLTRFQLEYQTYFNKDFLLFYYIVTEALLMADSRVKNMMLATWGKQEVEYKDYKTGTIQKANNYIFYPIFYDMDTMLGLDNAGYDKFSYYQSDDQSNVYNGKGILWQFVKDALSFELDQMYAKLEEAGLHAKFNEDTYDPNSILPYFNEKQSFIPNEAQYNCDAWYKYIRPWKEGYYLPSGKFNGPGTATFLYAMQGNRALMREDFVRDRLTFLNGKHESESFKTGSRVTFRLNYPKNGDSKFEGHEETITNEETRPINTFTLTAIQPCYAGVLVGANGTVKKTYFDFSGNEQLQSKDIIVPEVSQANGTESYILGIENLSDFGDLSRYYPQKLIIEGNTKVQRLTLGNPHKDYYNPHWQVGDEGNQSNPISIAACTNLREFNMQNCAKYYESLDFSNCKLINKILLTGSSVSQITLPDNGFISELRLPLTITELKINNHKALTTDNFSIGTYDYKDGNKIGDGIGEYVNDYSSITSVEIIDTPIDTYTLMNNAPSLSNYKVLGFEWHIDSIADMEFNYASINLGANPDLAFNEDTMYIWNPQSKAYVNAKKEQFDEAKELDSTAITQKVYGFDNNKLIHIPILDALHSKTRNKNSATLLEGTIIIDLSNEEQEITVDEYEIYQQYHDWYPNVKIEYKGMKVTQAIEVKFYNNENGEGEPYHTVLTDGNETYEDLMPSITPQKQSTKEYDYTFKGWAPKDDSQAIISPSEKPIANIELVPCFKGTQHEYTITLHGEESVQVIKYYYNQKLTDKPPIYWIPYKAHPHETSDDKDNNYRYGFKGWISKEDYENAVTSPEIIDINTYQVDADKHFYAYYKEENCIDCPSPEEYFIIESRSPSQLGGPYNTISIKEQYLDKLKGAITIPAKVNGQDVQWLNDLVCGSSGITKIYIMDNENLKGMGGFTVRGTTNTGITSMPSLICVHFGKVNTDFKFASYSFYYNSNLTHIYNLPNVTVIPVQLFRNCQQLQLSELPSNVTTIQEQAFAVCQAITISVLGCQDPNNMVAGENKVTFIGPQAFSDAGQNVTNLTLNSSITKLEENCFSGFGSENLAVVNKTALTNVNEYFDSNVTISDVTQ